MAPPDGPNEVDVCRVGDNTLDTGTTPIIFVPGVMGSRLSFPSLGQFWDPDSNWRMWHWIRIGAERARTELGIGTGAVVMSDGDSLTAAQRARGWGGVAWSFYGEFITDLDNQTFGTYDTPVYVIGYDWRQSNLDSGRAVATRIDEILTELGAENFILVSHSMGGLVTRACLHTVRNHGVGDKCKGIIHIAQPVHGGVVLVRRMFTGSSMAHDGGYNVGAAGFTTILGNDRQKALTISSGMPGPLQLLVTPNYREVGPMNWYMRRTFENPEQGFQAWTGRTWDLYQQAQSPPGLLPPATESYAPSTTARADLTRNIRRAAVYHDWIGVWKHAQTWSIYGTGGTVDTRIPFSLPPQQVRTEVLSSYGHGPPIILHHGLRADGSEALVSDPDPEGRGLIVTQTANSDGTVPVPSAQGLFPGQAHPIAVGTDYTTHRQFEVNDASAAAAHDAICHHPRTEVCTFDIIRHILTL